MFIWSYVKQHLGPILSLCSLVASIVALRLSYVKWWRETQPILYPRGVSKVHSSSVEIENVGPVTAVDIALTLIETVKRPSGKLSVPDMLKPGEKSTVSAYDYPEAVEAELPLEFFEDIVYKSEQIIHESEGNALSNGRDVRIPATRIAHHLLFRAGGQLLVIKYRAPDRAKQIVRLFAGFRRGDGFPQFKPGWKLLAGFRARLAEWRYRHNSEFAPPFKLLAFLDAEGDAENGKERDR